MISSMTGYGRGEVTEGKITAVAELRSVNNRYFEVSARLPRTMTLRGRGQRDYPKAFNPREN
jgi:uncharacterized protein (TIGR00255 family)